MGRDWLGLLAENAVIYIAGRMRGVENLNRPAFAKAADKLRSQGHAVYNPAAANLEGSPLPRIMAQVLTQLCECDTIALLPGWWRSGGARIEWMVGAAGLDPKIPLAKYIACDGPSYQAKG